MKVLLLSVNASWTHSCPALYYLRNAVSELDLDVEIVELTLKQNSSEALEIFCGKAPDVLCLSVYIWNVEYYKRLVSDLRKLLPQTIIVAGGPEISFNPGVADIINPDFLIIGYGEKAFRDLAEQRFQSEEKVIQGEQIPLQQIPFPYTEEDKTLLKGKMIYYEASRGCAFRCIYCLSAREEKPDWLSVERVCADIDKLLEFQPKVIKFVDRSFNQNKHWARPIWKYVIGLNTKVTFHFEVHPDLLEAEDIEILSNSSKGRIQLEIGIQTIHPETMKLICRHSDWSKVKTSLEALREQTNIPLHTDLIVGLPGENRQQIIESINAVLKVKPHELQLGFLKILAGTPMFDYARQHGYIWSETSPYNVLQTPDLSFQKIAHLEKISLIINQYWNKGDFRTVWTKAIEWCEPYQCLEQLLQLNLARDGALHSIDRVSRFNLMANWIEQNLTDGKRSYLLDALNWDWCSKAGEAWYPNALKASAAMDFRKERYTEILDWLKNEFWQNENWNLKRFIVFSAASNLFCKDYLNGYTKAVFVSVKDSVNAVVIYEKQF